MIRLIRNAPERFAKSFGYSWDGLKATFHKEESFRLEGIAFGLVIFCLLASPWPIWKCLTFVATFLLIPMVEILNSAIEDICDGISRDHVPFIKNAKDKGALAVLMAIVINVVVLMALLLI
ncbi:MAG: diacylglycerol kinase [Planctomycetaceae bacterium]|nr:diacylglycerol kinase [Planctomycetaceae bacterium]